MLHVSHLRGPEAVPVPHDVFSDVFLSFVKWSQGQSDLERALTFAMKAFGAEAVCLSRRERDTSSYKSVQIIDTCRDHARPKLDRAFMQVAFPGISGHLKKGASILVSDVISNSSRDDDLSVWMMRRKISDIGVICLGSSNGTADFLEFHLSSVETWAQRAPVIGAMLAEIYAGRRVGLIARQLMADCSGDEKSEKELILAPDNPAKLTKSEWRLCVLIGSGLSRDRVVEELCITKNTVRTHLRNIYAKTGCDSFHELALRLVQPCEQQHLPSYINLKVA